MTPEQLQALQGTIAESIEKNVNGKIRMLDAKIDTYIREDNEYKTRITNETNEWRKGADDKLAIVGSVQGFWKVMLFIGSFLAVFGGIWFSVLQALKFIRGN